VLRQRLGIGPQDPIIGIVANLRPVKRHADLLHAFARVRARMSRAHLIVVGSGELKHELWSLANALQIQPFVHFIGSSPDVVPIIKNCAVCVLCSDSEGLSNAIIEYLGCGRPVVCTDTGGNPELVQDGVNGFLVPVGDVSALANRIVCLLGDDRLSESMSAHAVTTFAGRFTVERMVAQHEQLYAFLLGEDRPDDL